MVWLVAGVPRRLLAAGLSGYRPEREGLEAGNSDRDVDVRAGARVTAPGRLVSRWRGGSAPAPARFGVALAPAVTPDPGRARSRRDRRDVRRLRDDGMDWIHRAGSGYSAGSLGSVAGVPAGVGAGPAAIRGGAPCACSARARSSAIRSWRHTVTEQAQPSR